MTGHPVGGLILAGGAGRRAGRCNKLLTCNAAGTTMIARTIENARSSRLDRLLVVLGHDAARLRCACLEARTIIALDHAEGIAGSLRRGIGVAVEDGWIGALICLGDMPLVTSALIDRLLTVFTSAPEADAVVPLVGSLRGNPVLWHRRMFPHLLELRGDTGGRVLLDRMDTRTVTVETADPAVLADFDTPERLLQFAQTR